MGFQMLVGWVILVVLIGQVAWSQMEAWYGMEYEMADEALRDASAYLMKGFSPYNSPCENFNNYACGSWSWNNDNADDEFQRSANVIRSKLLEAIQSDDAPSDWFVPQFKLSVQTFFKQCLNDNVTKSDVLLQLFEGLTRIMGSSPMLSMEGRLQIEKENIWYLLGKIKRDLVTDIFFTTSVDVLSQGCSEKTAVLRFSPAIAAEMYDFMNSSDTTERILMIASALNIGVDEKTVVNEVEKMLTFEKNLMSFLSQSQAERDAKMAGNSSDEIAWGEYENAMTSDEDPIGMAKLMAINPNISWSDFFSGLFSETQLWTFNENSTVVIVQDHDYFRKLTDLVESTDLEVIFNYIFWKALHNYDTYTFMTPATTDDGSTQSIQDTCLSVVMELFPAASVKILFDHNKWDVNKWRGDIEIVADTVFSAFKFLIMSNDWLTTEDKSLIMRKVNGIKFSPGLPAWLSEDYYVNERTIYFNESYSAYENLLQINANGFEKQLDMLIGGSTSDEPEPSFTTNAYYWNMSITNLLGIALPPLYHPDYPLPLKYGVLGAAIGRQLLRAFDYTNINEFQQGTSKWLSYSSQTEFAQKKQCLQKQLNSYCAKEKIRCDFGSEVINELIADIDGIKIAYMAYKFANQVMWDPSSVPGFNDLTGDQLFFLSNARAWCSLDRSTQQQFSGFDLNVHAPSKARTDAAFRNFPVFAETFQCPVGSKYAPAKTCEIWGYFE